MHRLLAIALLLPALASAEVLVRNCPTPTTCGWVRPANAVTVQVRREGIPLVPLAGVQPNEYIAACYDDPAVAIGSNTPCKTVVPGRSDLWQLKSVLYPATPPPPPPQGTGSIQISVDAGNPKWDSGEPIPSNLLPDLYVRIYGAPEGQAKTLIDAAPWAPLLTFRHAGTGRWCFAASLALDTTGDKIPDIESEQKDGCEDHTLPAPVLKLMPPNSLSLQTPAP
jgi:hypothetical protein